MKTLAQLRRPAGVRHPARFRKDGYDQTRIDRAQAKRDRKAALKASRMVTK